MFTATLPSRVGLHTVMELLCCHFISSLEYECGFDVFLRTLSWAEKAAQVSPEIGFLGAIALIHRTCLFSLPGVVQAHLLLLTSRCISDLDLGPNLVAFQDAMDLYVRYLPAFGIFNRTGSVKTPLSCLAKKIPRSTCINNATDQKLKSQTSELLFFCQLRSADDIFGSSDHLTEENQHMLLEKFRKEATIVVNRIFSHILHCAKQKQILESDAKVSEDIICLAAVIRLMGSSLLQFLQHFSQMRPANDTENVDHVALCKKYNLICETICLLLGQYEADELHRCDLYGVISEPIDRKKASILLLAHFTSLSVCCARRSLGFVWKGCIVMMMMAVNLLIVEEQSMSMLEVLIDEVLIDVSKESAVFSNTEEGDVKVYVLRQCSTVIAI